MTDATAVDVAALRKGLGGTGCVDGQNVTVGWDACCGLGTPAGRSISGILGAKGVTTPQRHCRFPRVRMGRGCDVGLRRLQTCRRTPAEQQWGHKLPPTWPKPNNTCNRLSQV
jgi:hypothetical protein